MPNVTMLPVLDANGVLFQAGYTHVEFINEPFEGVLPGYIHRQDPMWDLPVERIRKIKV